MLRILLDQNVPIGLIAALPAHAVQIASRIGWGTLENGVLLAAAESAGFEVLLTADQGMSYQQNLTGRRIALVVLSTNHWPTIEANIGLVRQALQSLPAAGFISVAIGRAALRRRHFGRKPDC